MAILSLTLFLLLSGPQLTKQYNIELQVEPVYTTDHPFVLIDKQERVFFLDYWAHRIRCLNPNGEIAFDIGRPGNGPGEHFKPSSACFLEKETILAVWYADCSVQLFSTSDGTFLRQWSPYFSGIGIVQWGDRHILASSSIKIIIGNWEGEIVESFPMPDLIGPNNPTSPTSRTVSCCVIPNTSFYFAEGAFPEILVGHKGQQELSTWALLTPTHYKEPPRARLDSRFYFNREKVEAYFDSFTQIDRLGMLRGHFLAVNWRLPSPYPFSLDIYRLAGRELVLRDFRPPGPLVATVGDKLYFITLSEGLDNDSADRHLLHVYQIVEESL
jgi:hypothetical protein